MGWGVELDWLDLHKEGCVLGIVDAVRVRHEGRAGGGLRLREWYLRRPAEPRRARH